MEGDEGTEEYAVDSHLEMMESKILTQRDAVACLTSYSIKTSTASDRCLPHVIMIIVDFKMMILLMYTT